MTSTLEPEPVTAYAATEQHIRLLQNKRAKITSALMDAERQYAAAVGREFEAGRITWSELFRAYNVIRDGEIKHFLSRWQEAVPYTPQHMRVMVGTKDIERWSGRGMTLDGAPRPPKGVCVVYILHGEDSEPVYVGSTSSFAVRLAAHRRSGKVWSSWQAHRCRDRAHAYEIEQRFLDQFKPFMNKMGGHR